MGVSASAWAWLAWGGWDGIGAISGLVALVGVAIALWQIKEARNTRAIYGLHWSVERTKRPSGDFAVTVTARVMGSDTLYEVRWLSTLRLPAQDAVAAWSARDEPISVEVFCGADALVENRVALTWVRPTWRGPQSQAERVSLDANASRYEYWRRNSWTARHIGRRPPGEWAARKYRKSPGRRLDLPSM